MTVLDVERHQLVSVDVFDTILLRGTESERRRMSWIAGRMAQALSTLDFVRSASSLLAARLDAQTIAYDALRITGDLGDVKLMDIHRLLALALGLPERVLPTLAEAEIQVDARTLRGNTLLVRRLESLRAAGVRVVAVSDTYYSAVELRRLLQASGALSAFGAVYASADYAATKKSGRLFPLVAEAEGVDLAKIFHMGDDRLADVDVPKAKGLATLWAPRPWRVRWARKIDGLWLQAAPGAARGALS